MSEKFEVGELVRLNSGGPAMTVRSALDILEWMECEWFAGDERKVATFHKRTVYRVVSRSVGGAVAAAIERKLNAD